MGGQTAQELIGFYFFSIGYLILLNSPGIKCKLVISSVILQFCFGMEMAKEWDRFYFLMFFHFTVQNKMMSLVLA